MIRPPELRAPSDVWDALSAASSGDVATLSRLLERDANAYRAQYWYTEPIHFAVREGHLDAVRLLLDAGADPDVRGSTETISSQLLAIEDTSRWRSCSNGRVPPGAERR